MSSRGEESERQKENDKENEMEEGKHAFMTSRETEHDGRRESKAVSKR